MNNIEIIITVFVIALGTALTRFAAFALFPKERKVPDFIKYLGKALPPAVFGLLLVYCLKGVNVSAAPYGLPEFIALAVVVILHLKWRQILISVAGGTVVYMVLVQFVFL